LPSTFPFTTPIAFSQSPDGTVTDTVLGEQNQPIPGAQVCTVVRHQSKPGHWVNVKHYFGHSDKTGPFQIQHLSIGTFSVSAEKIEDGYPGVNDTNVFPVVSLTPEEPFARVIVKLGPRSSILAPFVEDKVTGKRIFNFLVSWTVDHPEQPGTRLAGRAEFSAWTTHTSLPMGVLRRIGTTTSNASAPSIRHAKLDVELEPEIKGARRSNTDTTS
jgi:hypothetical protein